MRRVTGVGGIFFKAADPTRLAQWYAEHLGITLYGESMAIFRWNDEPRERDGITVWSVFDRNDEYFRSDTPFMVNYRVENLDAVLAALRAEGVTVDDRVADSAEGKFGWLSDPEGNRIELWQPPS